MKPNILSITIMSILAMLLPFSSALLPGEMINAQSTWKLQSHGINLTGKGQTICVIDTGIDYNHPDFGCFGNNNPNSECKILGDNGASPGRFGSFGSSGGGTFQKAGILLNNENTTNILNLSNQYRPSLDELLSRYSVTLKKGDSVLFQFDKREYLFILKEIQQSASEFHYLNRTFYLEANKSHIINASENFSISIEQFASTLQNSSYIFTLHRINESSMNGELNISSQQSYATEMSLGSDSRVLIVLIPIIIAIAIANYYRKSTQEKTESQEALPAGKNGAVEADESPQNLDKREPL